MVLFKRSMSRGGMSGILSIAQVNKNAQTSVKVRFLIPQVNNEKSQILFGKII